MEIINTSRLQDATTCEEQINDLALKLANADLALATGKSAKNYYMVVNKMMDDVVFISQKSSYL